MHQDVKAKWVAALRSGKYEQGQYALNTDGENGKFCCLGVLCELAVEEGVVTRTQPWIDGEVINRKDYEYDHESGALPRAVREWAGLKHSNPTTTVPGSEVYEGLNDTNTKLSLAELNDNGKDFAYIASVIEREF
jgi:hypothetical protein